MMSFAGFLLTLLINGLSASMCPALGESSSIYDGNLAWACELKSWRTSMAEWKKLVEKECSTGGQYWQSLFECPDYSNVTCRNNHAVRHDYDVYNCHIITCTDGRYSDQKVIRKIWRKHFNAYKKIFEFYQKELRFCKHSDCSEFDASTEETPTTTAMNYVEAACSGGISIVDELNGTISSPNYPDNYPNYVLCTWYISVPDGMVITVEPGWSYDIESCSACGCDYLQFNHSLKFCGQNSSNPSFQTTVNYLIVIFKSDKIAPSGGFSFNWVASKTDTTQAVVEEDAALATVACSVGTSIVDKFNGTISSLNYPDNYPDDVQCSWHISVPDGMVITVQSGWSYSIENHPSCGFDYLQFNRGPKFCGQNSSNPSYQTTANSLTVIFKSDTYAPSGGFSFNWVASTVQEETTAVVAEVQSTTTGFGSADSTVATSEETSTDPIPP